MKTKTIYEAADGKAFNSAEACLDYERDLVWGSLAGLTPEDVADAIGGKNKTLADAFERVGAICTRNRIEAGGSKRKARAKAQVAA